MDSSNDIIKTDDGTEHNPGTPHDPQVSQETIDATGETGREPDGSGGGTTSAYSSNYPVTEAEGDTRIQNPADVPKSDLPATHEVTDDPVAHPDIVEATGDAATAEPVNTDQPTDPVKAVVQPQAAVVEPAPVVVNVNRLALETNPAAIAAAYTRTTVDGGSTEDYDPAERGRNAALIGEGNYEDRLRSVSTSGGVQPSAFANGQPIAAIPSMEHPGHSPEAVAQANLESTHVSGQEKKYAVLIPKTHSSDPSVRFSNGLTFHMVPVGIETEVGEAVYQVMCDSDVPFDRRPL